MEGPGPCAWTGAFSSLRNGAMTPKALPNGEKEVGRRAREERRRGIEEAPHQSLLSNKEDE